MFLFSGTDARSQRNKEKCKFIHHVLFHLDVKQ